MYIYINICIYICISTCTDLHARPVKAITTGGTTLRLCNRNAEAVAGSSWFRVWVYN